MNLFQRLRAWRRSRRFDQFREYLQTYEQAVSWGHGLNCLNCHGVNAAHAFYCSQCGESLREIQEQLAEPERKEVHTESLPVQQLPLGARQKAVNRWSNTQTQEIPSIRLRRKERQR